MNPIECATEIETEGEPGFGTVNRTVIRIIVSTASSMDLKNVAIHSMTTRAKSRTNANFIVEFELLKVSDSFEDGLQQLVCRADAPAVQSRSFSFSGNFVFSNWKKYLRRNLYADDEAPEATVA
ncbi:hypothetical protein EVAR_20278_1 [Eumeta japonica]|uniref:Uncharacterized protein n=1 Tax=Eumeta variegata TaxID=151549 RepID=A0A4C1VP43_EUMVA|nr:hypothetical protein EVAR_20278_1 [Eumeta japonica]